MNGQQLIRRAGKLHADGKYKQAERIYRQLLKANPNDITLLRVLGMLERDRSNLKAAYDWFTLGSKLSGNDPTFLAELGLTLEKMGKAEEAMATAIEANSLAPNNLSIAMFFARMCLSRGQAARAAAALEQSIGQDLNNTEACRLLSIAANNSGVLPVPLEYSQKLIQLQPNEAYAHSALGTAKRLNGSLDDSLKAYERALSIDDSFEEAIAGKAEVLESLGRTEDALAVLQPCSLSSSVLIALARTRIARKLGKPEDALTAIETVLSPTLSPHHRSTLMMQRGRVLEELERYDEAWASWVDGNQLHEGMFDLETHISLVDDIINTPLIAENPVSSATTQPIFIVGMFRSGTTLLEQILGAHPDIDAAGEVDQILRYVHESPYPSCMTNPTTLWPQHYLERLDSNALHCTDKMPMNYLHIGLINALFPNATIIHMARNPLDVCVSCFSNSFAASQAYTADLETLAAVYEQYQRIMEHWNTTLPNRIYEVSYESLVENHKKTIEMALQHIGVDYVSDVLDFYNIRRIAITPSADQVRKPIYTSSVGRWKRFEKHVTALTSRLQSSD